VVVAAAAASVFDLLAGRSYRASAGFKRVMAFWGSTNRIRDGIL